MVSAVPIRKREVKRHSADDTGVRLRASSNDLVGGCRWQGCRKIGYVWLRAWLDDLVSSGRCRGLFLSKRPIFGWDVLRLSVYSRSPSQMSRMMRILVFLVTPGSLRLKVVSLPNGLLV